MTYINDIVPLDTCNSVPSITLRYPINIAHHCITLYYPIKLSDCVITLMYRMRYPIKVSHESAVEVECSNGWWCDTLIGYINAITMFYNEILSWDTFIRYHDGIHPWDLGEVLNSVGKSYTIFHWTLRYPPWDTVMRYLNWIHAHLVIGYLHGIL